MGSGLPVNYWELPLSDAFFEAKSVAINDFLRDPARRWVKLAYFSRQTNVAVFISVDLLTFLTVTNNAEHIEKENNFCGLYY